MYKANCLNVYSAIKSDIVTRHNCRLNNISLSKAFEKKVYSVQLNVEKTMQIKFIKIENNLKRTYFPSSC